MLGPFTTASRLTPIHQVSLAVLSHAASMSTTTTTTMRDRGDRYGPMEWAQKTNNLRSTGSSQETVESVLRHDIGSKITTSSVGKDFILFHSSHVISEQL